jgi:hypothetical protein
MCSKDLANSGQLAIGVASYIATSLGRTAGRDILALALRTATNPWPLISPHSLCRVADHSRDPLRFAARRCIERSAIHPSLTAGGDRESALPRKRSPSDQLFPVLGPRQNHRT